MSKKPKTTAVAEEAKAQAAPTPAAAPAADPGIGDNSSAPAATAEPPVAASALPPTTLHSFAAELAGAVRQMRAGCQARLAQSESNEIARAADFLHEAGQWLDKAVLNLKAAGI